MGSEKLSFYLLSSTTLFLSIFSFSWIVSSQDLWAYNTDPKWVLNHVVDRVNDWNNDKVIWSELDRVSGDDPIYGSTNKIANTLESLRFYIAVYLQWLSFAAMVMATILIIYNGLRLVLTPMQPEEVANVKKRLIYIFLWLLVATWFYYLIKIILSISIQATD